MSVYTPVSTDELAHWLTRYNVGTLVELEPIAAGIENTNYFVTTTAHRLVLTLYERLPAEDLPFYLNLMAHLAQRDVPCAAPVADRSHTYFSMLNGKPASLVTRLSGSPVMSPADEHCAAVGRSLAQLHLAGMSYRVRHTNPRGPAWWKQAARAVKPFLTPGQQDLLAAELAYQRDHARARLPRGAIHADLFRDNVLFEHGRLSGIIDFGFAATDALAYDIAITVNDWCVDAEGNLSAQRQSALLLAYEAVRALSDEEKAGWPGLLRAAALRFWLSRLYDLYLPRPGELTHAHDPGEFERILRARAAAEPPYPL
jgi:homoserine kinase type II